MPYLDKTQVQINCIDWLRSIGYDYVYGPEIAPGGKRAKRDSYGDVVLVER